METHEQAAIAAEEISQSELRRRILTIVWPVTADSVLQLLVSFVSTGLVGRLGDLAMSAVSLSSRITQFAWAIFGGVSTATTVLVARAIGAKDKEAARNTAVQALIVSVGLIAFMTVALFSLARPILLMLNATGELLSLSMGYLSIALFTLPLVAIMQVIGGVARGMGDTRTPMLISFCVNVINAISGWILIYGNLGFPAYGINGAAMAAVISQSIGASLALIYISSSRGIGLRPKDFLTFSRQEAVRILRIGIPASTEMVFWQMATMLMMGLMVTFGTVSLAAHNLGLQAEGISYMPGAGFGVAATTLIGHSLGAQNPQLARRYFREILTWGITLSSFTSLLLLFGNIQLMSVLTDQRNVIELGAYYLWLMSFTQVPSLVTGIISGTLRSSGDVQAPMIIAAVGMWGLRIPLSFILGAEWGMNLGVHGVWYAMTIDLFVRLALAIWRYRKLSWDTVRVL
ncbi:MAG: MATE family efflux transporter [Symbiobacteriaceae bacterium]|nr:MATE family efflux transporter [Symbiobacteriaceae bacterium]